MYTEGFPTSYSAVIVLEGRLIYYCDDVLAAHIRLKLSFCCWSVCGHAHAFALVVSLQESLNRQIVYNM